MSRILKIKYYFFYYLLYIKNCYHKRERERERGESRVYLAIAKEGRRSVEKRWETLGQSIVFRLRDEGRASTCGGRRLRRTRLDRQ